MRLLDDAGQVWIAHFHHIKIDHPLIKSSINGPFKTAKWATFCTLHKGECRVKGRPCLTTPIFEGKTWCNPVDTFSRYTGRKLAFTRALALALPSMDGPQAAAYNGKGITQVTKLSAAAKVTRGALWAAYWAAFTVQAPTPGDGPLAPEPVEAAVGIAPAGEDVEVRAKSA